ncbi:MAG: conjugal transfer pilus assembly protein TraK [Leptothrix sp. (in: Bacteria)]|nr:conjugal transfer pilus assembly protein TraK [Leptothrix sp. (in: b-proteobacteria)]
MRRSSLDAQRVLRHQRQQPRHRRLGLAVASAFLSVIAPPPALALQVLDARDGVAIEAILSIKEPTRIRIEGAPITDVFGNIYSSSCGAAPPALAGQSTGLTAPAINPGGEIVLECDRDKGEIYVRPINQTPDGGGKPVNLFISSAQATYTLVLRRSDTPADTIVIRDPAAHRASASTTRDAPTSSSANHVRAMKAMLVAMASDRMPADIHADEVGLPVQLWAETKFSLMRRYEGRSLVGEKYLLQNLGSAVMVLAEQEFDRPDSKTGGQVLGVAVESHNLRPGESTNVFVIRRGGER